MDCKGKIINFLGDSITEGVGVEDVAQNRYDNILKRRLGLKAVYNYGVSGTRIAHQSRPSEKPRYDLCFCGRAYDLHPDADIIIVYGGINDFIHGDAPIGAMGDTTPATFYGGVDFLMRLLTEHYPNAKILFLTPARCAWNNRHYNQPSNRIEKRDDAKEVRFYGEVIMKTAEKYHISVLDLFEKLPIEPTNPEERETYTSDGLHFNDEGHKVLAKVLEEFLVDL